MFGIRYHTDLVIEPKLVSSQIRLQFCLCILIEEVEYMLSLLILLVRRVSSL